jgi:hypothetical protein
MERGREIMESRVVKSFTDEEKETFYRLLNKAIDNLKD